MLKDDKDRKLFFEKMVSEHSSKLYAHIRTIVLDHDDADDVLQETLIKAWKSLDSFRGDAAMGTWLYRIATNEALQQLRRERWKRLFRRGRFDESEAPKDMLNNSLQAGLVLDEALKLLSLQQRKVFGMRYFNEATYAEIALVLEIAEGTVKATYHQSMKKIEVYLKNHSY